jgi:ParB family transcriptional regulator, chromosome partitioning protein
MKKQEILTIPIAEISVLNPRARNRRKWLEIVTSIQTVGLKRPITVSRRDEPTAGKRYDLVCGQGRIEAFSRLGETTIPAIVINASTEDQHLMSLVENLARRKPSNRSIVYEVKALRGRGNSGDIIAQKLGAERAFAYGLINLIEQGEESLVEHVEAGRLPISVAVEIARGNDHAVSLAMSDAYQTGQLRGAKLRAVRQLIASRVKTGKAPEGKTGHEKRITARTLVKVYEQTVRQQQALVARAQKANSQLLLLSSMFRELLSDEKFAALLRAEHLSDIPAKFAERISQ